MKINGRKIRSKSMRKRRNWRRKLLEMNRTCSNRIEIKKIEKKLGMNFITNFDSRELANYQKAITETGLDLVIVDRAYYANGNGLIKGMKALYCDKKINSLSRFWEIVDGVNYSFMDNFIVRGFGNLVD